MAVAYYQLFIAGTILLASLGVGHLRHWLGRPNLTPTQATVVAGAGWSLFTLTHVVMLPLMVVQMLTIWGTVGLLWHLRRRKRDIAGLRQALAQLGPETQDRFDRSDRQDAVMPLRGRAHRGALHKAFSEARCSVVILSGWVNDYVVDRDFKRILTDTLARGVDVYIGYGWTPATGPAKPSSSEERAITLLECLANEAERAARGRLFVAKWPNHAKVLICDEAYAICGSYNWLSNPGIKNDERSWMVADPEFVRLERDEIVQRIREGAAEGWPARASATSSDCSGASGSGRSDRVRMAGWLTRSRRSAS
ncbi:MAG: phospholipase D-like domain-containing protein [Geminicoccaceae bacterium]